MLFKGGSNKSFNPDIAFAEINFLCKHVHTYKARPSKGERHNTRTEKMDCPFVLKFKASLDDQTLMLFNMNAQHSH